VSWLQGGAKGDTKKVIEEPWIALKIHLKCISRRDNLLMEIDMIFKLGLFLYNHSSFVELNQQSVYNVYFDVIIMLIMT